ncbi:hypothetical protein D3C73_1585910 [compost metagenome]
MVWFKLSRCSEINRSGILLSTIWLGMAAGSSATSSQMPRAGIAHNVNGRRICRAFAMIQPRSTMNARDRLNISVF